MADHQITEAPASPSPSALPARPARGRRRWLRVLLWLLLGLIVAVALALGGLLWWIGRDDSLATTLQQVSRWLPAEQSLSAKEVTGSVRRGGRIGWLQWQSPTMKVEVRDANIGWQLRPLVFGRTLKLGEVHIAELEIASTPDPQAEPSQPLQSLTLPLQIQLPFKVDRIVWKGPPEVVVQDLSGRYEYMSGEHALDIDQVHVADGDYQLKARIQGAAPMQTQLQLLGQLQTANPLQAQANAAEASGDAATSASVIEVQAKAQVEGTLATADAQLTISAHAQAQPPSVGAGAAPSTEPMQADIQARIAPWQAQPLISAQADLQQLNIAAFWPGGPRTLLSGSVQAGPGTGAATGSDTGAESATQANSPPSPTSSSASESPSAAAWALSAQLHNALPGPWDAQRLPLRQLQATVNFDGTQWRVEPAVIDIGQGQLHLAGHYQPEGQVFDGALQVRQLNPADLLSTLAAFPLSGTAQARSLPPAAAPTAAADPSAATPTPAPSPAVAFSADLKAQSQPAGRSRAAALHIRSMSTQGQWQAPLLQLRSLQLDALGATVDGRTIEFNTETQLARAQLKAQVPGAQLQLAGQIAPQEGQGQSTLQLQSLKSLMQWLGQLPGVKNPLDGASLEGSAQADLSWRGGYGALLQRLNAAPGAALPASGLQLQAKVQADQIRYQPAKAAAGSASGSAANSADSQPAPALLLQQLRLQVDGSPESAQITLSAQARQAAQSVQLQTQLQAGLSRDKGAAPLDWQASLSQLQAQLNLASAKALPAKSSAPATTAASAPAAGSHAWQLQLAPGAPVTISQRTSGNTVLNTVWQLGSGGLQVTPPRGAASALLQWEDSRFTQLGNGQWGLRSAGRAQGIPLAWVDAFSQGTDEPPLQAAGLSGDLSFNGQWNVDTLGPQLKADVVVERASGDLRLAVDDGGGTTVIQTSGPTAHRAGGTRTRTVSGSGMRTRIKQARLAVQANGRQLTAQLNWDSERAGTAQAEISTQLSYSNNAWSLPPSAPLQGRVQANMPDLNIWALFAPPGWRMSGTLAANATLSGTISAPLWQGDLSADGLSIASVLDGVDLRNGRLRAKLQGTRLDITELSLQGGQGSNARILGFSGNLTSAPTDGGTLIGSGYAEFTPASAGREAGLSMRLQAKASGLQVLVRADRQVSVSGDLLAQLEQGQFTLRGDLTVDRASILLPEESAPSLDKDVVVRSAAQRQAEALARQKQEREAQREQARVTPSKLPDILVNIDLGRDFALQGFGIVTRLRGNLQVRGATTVGGLPSITGEIHTVQGRYRAWGQALDVESGIIRFNGPMNNPSLDILAVRPNIAVKAGVQIMGTASAPRVRLYSDPALPDAEVLSWVIMGRDPASGGASSALLQQAAMALLAGGNSGSGRIAGSLGLDEIGFRGGGDGDTQGAALTLGKRLSDKLYLTYEQSLSGAMGIIYIFYDLSRNLTLRAQTGVTSALDLVYTVRKD